MINCLGCRVGDVKTIYCNSMCPIRICALYKKIETCGICEKWKNCDKIKMIIDSNKEACENLKSK